MCGPERQRSIITLALGALSQPEAWQDVVLRQFASALASAAIITGVEVWPAMLADIAQAFGQTSVEGAFSGW